ncbi:unnamed protein product [Lathyrus oleraceus]
MRMQKRYGKIETGGEFTEKEIIRAERNSGVVSSKVREIQMQNYLRKKELKERRENDLREGLRLYKNAKYEEALEKFESVLGTKPEPDEAAVASYNVACCYSKLNQCYNMSQVVGECRVQRKPFRKACPFQLNTTPFWTHLSPTLARTSHKQVFINVLHASWIAELSSASL